MLGKFAELMLFGIAPLFLSGLLMPGVAAAEEITISGEVAYRERIALPPHAVLTVRLVDMSLADAPETVLGEHKVDPAGQVPIKFEIKIDPAVVQQNASYALQARISVDNQLWFINDERYAVDLLKPEPQKMMLKMVRQDSAAKPSLVDTNWLAEDIEGKGVIDKAQSTLSISSAGKVTGQGGCNRYFAQAEINGDKIRVRDVGATMMACAEALMDQERRFFTAIEKAASYRIDGDGKLFLTDAGGADLVRFAPQG